MTRRSPEGPKFVYREIPDKNKAGSSHLGQYVSQFQGVQAEAHHQCVEKKTRSRGQAEHHGGLSVSGCGFESDSVIQVIVKTDTDQVSCHRGGNGIGPEPLDEQNQYAELYESCHCADAGKFPQLEKGLARLGKSDSKPRPDRIRLT